MKLLNESRSILTLAIPLVINQLGQMLLGVADTVMVGHLGNLDLAALSYASAIFHIPLVFGIGILTCIAVRSSTAQGKNDQAMARNCCRNGFYLSSLIGLAFALLAWAWVASGLHHQLGQSTEVADRMPDYFLLIMASLIPGMMAIGLKNHSDALNHPWPGFWISMGGVLLNIFLNWLLIYGHWGCPEMGLEGAGIATVIARVAILVGMFIWFFSSLKMRPWLPDHWLKKPDWKEAKEQVHLGLPAGLQMLCEVGAFSAAGVLIGHFGKDALAAHQIALSATGTAFMIPLGLSMALTMRMGAVSSHPLEKQRSIACAGWVLTLICSVTTAVGFLFFGTTIASWFNDDTQLITAVASLLFIAGIFQIVDGLQVASAGMLRGLHDTRYPAVFGFIAYWVIGIPAGYLLAFHLGENGMGPEGVWWGLAIGLAVASLTLSQRLWRMTRATN